MATFVSTSPISGSDWDGPTGCPIISPSNWQAQVLDNLTILANHNHSGSAGEGIAVVAASFFPTIDNDYFSAMFPVASTGAVVRSVGGLTTSVPAAGGVRLTGDGATVEYDIYTRTGEYNIGAYMWQDATDSLVGVVNVFIDNACIGTMQGEITIGDGVLYNRIAGASLVGAGERRLKLSLTASAGGTCVGVSYLFVRRVSN